jgi:hypothetical protein
VDVSVLVDAAASMDTKIVGKAGVNVNGRTSLPQTSTSSLLITPRITARPALLEFSRNPLYGSLAAATAHRPLRRLRSVVRAGFSFKREGEQDFDLGPFSMTVTAKEGLCEGRARSGRVQENLIWCGWPGEGLVERSRGQESKPTPLSCTR